MDVCAGCTRVEVLAQRGLRRIESVQTGSSTEPCQAYRGAYISIPPRLRGAEARAIGSSANNLLKQNCRVPIDTMEETKYEESQD